MPDFVTVAGVVAGLVSFAASSIAVYSHFRPSSSARITNPLHLSENGGRWITVSGSIARPKRQTDYWIAVQPADCRADDLWWPQNQPLELSRAGAWTLKRVRLGREEPEGRADVGKSFTIGLFEVVGHTKTAFLKNARIDDALTAGPGAQLLHSVEVRRVGKTD